MGGLKMKLLYSLFVVASSIAVAQAAEERIYRCGNEYTNTVTEAQAKTCKLLSGGNVTVIQAVKPSPPKAGATGPKSDTPDQRAKEADARLILESELQKAEARQAELLKEYNNGEPERLGSESRNNQKYLDRVAALKASLARNESDISGIKRELSRLSPASSSASNAK
jgi:hypothetical protein